VRGLATSASSQDDVVDQDERVLAFVPSSRWPTNPGHVLVVPTAHEERRPFAVKLREFLDPGSAAR